MKAIQINDYGGREGLGLNEVAIPAPTADEVLVKLAYAGVNFIDIYMREGHYRHSATYGTPPPYTPGMEGSGVIESVGANVSSVVIGDRVAWCLSRGSYAEYAVVPAWKLSKIPDAVDFETATTLMLQGCTAHYLSHSLFPIKAEHTCLIHSGAGGVGQQLIQHAKHRGAVVLTTVGSEHKASIAKSAGADHAILYKETDFQQAVMEITNGKGVNVVYDAVGKDTIDQSIKSLAVRGTCVNYGGSSGLVDQISPLALAEAGSVFFTRPHLAHYMRNAEEIMSRTNRLFSMTQRGSLKTTIDQTFPLADAALAHEKIETGKTTGKLLLKMESQF